MLSSSLGFLDRRDQLLLEQLVRRLWETILFYRSGGARRCRKQPRVRKHNEEDGLQRGKFHRCMLLYLAILLSRLVVRSRELTSRPPNANSNLTSVPAHSWHVINSPLSLHLFILILSFSVRFSFRFSRDTVFFCVQLNDHEIKIGTIRLFFNNIKLYRFLNSYCTVYISNDIVLSSLGYDTCEILEHCNLSRILRC